MVASASICSETRIVPSSVAMAEPARPVTINPVSTGASSRAIDRPMLAPTRLWALKSEKANEIWRAKTAPAKKAVSTTTESEPKPIASIARRRFRGKWGGRTVSTKRRAPRRAIPPRSARTPSRTSPTEATNSVQVLRSVRTARRCAPRPVPVTGRTAGTAERPQEGSTSPRGSAHRGVDEEARHAGTDPAKDLVMDGARPRGDLVRADLGVALPPEENHLVPHLRAGDLGDVDHALVHADGADDRRAAAAHQHLAHVGEAAGVAVRIADREGGDAGTAFRNPARSVGDGRARLHLLQVRDLRAPAQGGPQPNAVAIALGRVSAVEHDARAHEAAVRVGAGDRGGAVGQMDPPWPLGEARDHRLHLPDLTLRERAVREVGVREVRGHALEDHAFRARRFEEGGDLAGLDADATHPGVHLQMGHGRLAQRARGGSQALQVLLAEDEGGEVLGHEQVPAIAVGAA